MRLPSIGWLFLALGGIATTVRSSFRLKSVSNPRKAVKVPFILRNPMNNDTPSIQQAAMRPVRANPQIPQMIGDEIPD